MKRLAILYGLILLLLLTAGIVCGCNTFQELHAVWGSSSSDVFAVGRGGNILHYNGTSWSKMNSGTSYSLYAIWGTSSSDVFAVGHDGTILHYNGTSWSKTSFD